VHEAEKKQDEKKRPEDKKKETTAGLSKHAEL
jgi:hypothetical protein